jgi:hypothetical protein
VKAAIADQASGVEVQAGPDAPLWAICPTCGDPVELRRGRGWYYRHMRGAGAECGQRKKPVGNGSMPSKPERIGGDPYVAMAAAAVADAVLEAGEGDLLAILSVAFSQLVHLTLDRVRLSPEEVLERILDRDGAHVATAVVGDDEWEVMNEIERSPGPVFDVRARRDGCEQLYRSPWYVSLCRPVGPAQVRLLRLVLEQAERVYVLGEPEVWKQIENECMEDEEE